MLTHLCRIAQSFQKLGGSPITITIIDPDTVTEANLGRQCFCEADVGLSKAIVLAQRARAFFGFEIEAEVKQFSHVVGIQSAPDVIVGCVDNLAARKKMHAVASPATLKMRQWGEERDVEHKGTYWLDMGNTADTGQVILGGHGLPTVFDVLPQMKKMREPKNVPSCSLAEALSRQDLFINSTLANLGGHLLWQLLRRGGLSHHGYFVNLSTGNVRPLNV